ncbi:MAG: extracellular solute-binding protein, partial [Eubacteriales bacterium]|nr:extracellular solute-binding protein [Eubacteriales bacterium]
MKKSNLIFLTAAMTLFFMTGCTSSAPAMGNAKGAGTSETTLSVTASEEMAASETASPDTSSADTIEAGTAGDGTGTDKDEQPESTAATTEVKKAEPFEPALDTGKSVELNIIGFYDNFPSLDTVYADFKEYYPNVSISYEKLDDYWNAVRDRLSSGQKVDIFMSVKSYSTTEQGIMSKSVNLADPQYGIDISALDSDVIKDNSADDNVLYRMPLYRKTEGLMVNDSLLIENGLSLPSNFVEFMHCCSVLKSKGYIPITGFIGNKNSSLVGTALAKSRIYVDAAHSSDPEGARKALNEASEGSAEEYLAPTLERLSQIIAAGYFDRDAAASIVDNYDSTILRFFEGDVGFMCGNTMTMSGTAKRESRSEAFKADPFKYTFIAAPLSDYGSPMCIESSDGFSVFNGAENLDYAIEFIRFFCTAKELNRSAEAKGLISTAADMLGNRQFPDLDFSDKSMTVTEAEFALDAGTEA